MWKKDTFYIAFDDLLDSAIEDTAEGTLEAAPKDKLNNLHKDAQECPFEVALKGAIQVPPLVALLYAMINVQMCAKWFI